ncbi:hypothetical protein [Candidatus Contubernalis alkaliaceticus]|uniref:hypothetical protein n=1 Tax=Candidatus Contubernalis alkaliaceticus TaxID=338645 RepID=UPI001F4BF898|nr:hypothetical protein [Candidatus Contubernalis alkalaceticus]UNC92730.1 hypothetical protein HUE98_11855 [Candidatus Contubernalis alkalaceticus]
MLNVATTNELMINVSLDNQRFYSKPAKKSIAIISSRIPKLINNNKLKNLAVLTGEKGLSWCPSTFTDGKRKIANFRSQQVFALDFDNGITWEDVKTRADRYRLPISFAYETFSSVNKNKFRVALCNDVVITDSRIAKIIQLALMEIFPECDISCKDCCRMFFGGKGLIYTNENIDKAVFNISDLMLSLVEYYRDTDKINYLRLIKKYAEQVGIELKNGLPWVELIDEDYENTKIEISGASPIYIYNIEDAPRISKNKYVVYFTEKIKKVKKDGSVTFSPTNTKTGRRDLIRNFNFDDLSNRCQLYRQFAEGERWCYHNELFGMATNLCQVKSGSKKFLEILNNIEFDSYTEKDWGYYVNYIQKMDYAPMRCENFCPLADDCEHAKNMILTAKTKRNTIVKLDNDLDFVSLQEAERDLKEKFVNIQKAKDDNIHVLVAQTGIGKSQLYIELLESSDKPYIIAVPTHKLKDEIYDRCKEQGYDVLKTPVLPEKLPQNVKLEIERLYALGATYIASKFIRKMAKEKNISSLIDYINKLDLLKEFKGHIITTHDRLLYFQEDQFSNHNIIIDEDIIKTLFKIQKVTVKDLLKIQKIEYISSYDKREVSQKYRDILLDTFYMTYSKVKPINLDNEHNFESQVADVGNEINSNVIGFLKSCAAYRYNPDKNKMTVEGFYSESDIIQYIVKHELPKTKIIILSATANEQIYQKVFGDRLRYHLCREAEYQGELLQYPERSFSRDCLKNDEELFEKVKNLVGDISIITYKSHKESESELNFGGLDGNDCYNGQDIAVVGTPHLNEIVYMMFAIALGVEINDAEMKYQEINWRYYNFWFMTYENKELRNIQLWFIESELEQAVGRARLLRNDSKVYLFSNFPLKQASFRYMDSDS